MWNRIAPLVVCLSPLSFVGCGGDAATEIVKAPRPVSVVSLTNGQAPTARRVAGTVESWKTEQIGFEVDGRVRWVVEPGMEIEGRVLDDAGNVVLEGTPLAKVDSERYELAVASAEAEVEVAQLRRDGIQITLEQGLPADLDAAASDVKLAQVEYDRVRRLVDQNAVAKAELDRATAQLSTAKAKQTSLKAQVKQTQAELNSAIASIDQAKQRLKDAKRSLSDTTLYSSFQGQVADVSVVPGSLLSPGQPAMTVQMVDPIKVSVELSAEQSRTIRRRTSLPVYITMSDGSVVEQNAYVYLISTNADIDTRTFTLELLVLNRKLTPLTSEFSTEENVGRATDLFSTGLEFLPDAPDGMYYIDERGLRRDAEGYFLWRAKNARLGQELPRLLDVDKLRVTPGDQRFPFIGDLVLQPVRINEGQEFNKATTVYAGDILVDDGTADDWDGEHLTVVMDEQWMLRPGDIVSVDLSESATAAGFFVPMNAVYEEAGKAYVFTPVTSGGQTLAKRVPVVVGDDEDEGVSTSRKIQFVGEPLPEGTAIIVDGVHFLVDGEPVAVRSDPS